MDAGLPILVFAPIDAASHRGRLSGSGSSGRMPSDRPVLLALDLDKSVAVWADYQVIHMRFTGLSVTGFAQITPSVVAIPLWSQGADAVQMLQRLSYLGFAGPVEVHSPQLPNARMVMAELSQVSGDLQIRLVQGGAPT